VLCRAVPWLCCAAGAGPDAAKLEARAKRFGAPGAAAAAAPGSEEFEAKKKVGVHDQQ
jgi:hypothetical protein